VALVLMVVLVLVKVLLIFNSQVYGVYSNTLFPFARCAVVLFCVRARMCVSTHVCACVQVYVCACVCMCMCGVKLCACECV
jgi:hypothetical protein